MPSGSSDRGSSRHSAGLLLRVIRPGAPAEEFYLAAGLAIGRSVANTVVLADDAVDRAHARVEIGDDGAASLRCVELAGMLVAGGRAARELALEAGSRFRIGRTEFECVPGRRVEARDAPEAGAACPHCGSVEAGSVGVGVGVLTCPACAELILSILPDPRSPARLLLPFAYGNYRAERFVDRGGMGLVLKGGPRGGRPRGHQAPPARDDRRPPAGRALPAGGRDDGPRASPERRQATGLR